MGRGRGRGRGRPAKIPMPPSTTTQKSPPKLNPEPSNASHEVTVEDYVSSEDDESEETPIPSANLPNCNVPEKPKEETNENKVPRKLWTDVISGNRKPENGMALEFFAPKIVEGKPIAEIKPEDIIGELKYWESALIMYVIGRDLSMNSVKQFMEKNWSFVKLPDLFYNDEGYFIMRFHSSQDKDEILSKGPYTIMNMTMLLRDWSPEFNLKRDMLRTIPIWIKLPQLPLYLWGAKTMGKIGSILGKPIVTDECTAQRLRISYARMLVEIDITQEMPKEVTIADNEGHELIQAVEYEWKPKYCGKCKKFGHVCEKPKVRKEKVWVPKPTLKSNEQEEGGPSNKETQMINTTNTEDLVSEWTTVQKAGKKTVTDTGTMQKAGKKIIIDTGTSELNCSNGFGLLGVVNDSLVVQEKVP